MIEQIELICTYCGSLIAKSEHICVVKMRDKFHVMLLGGAEVNFNRKPLGQPNEKSMKEEHLYCHQNHKIGSTLKAKLGHLSKFFVDGKDTSVRNLQTGKIIPTQEWKTHTTHHLIHSPGYGSGNPSKISKEAKFGHRNHQKRNSSDGKNTTVQKRESGKGSSINSQQNFRSFPQAKGKKSEDRKIGDRFFEGQKICHHFSKFGTCDYGDQCKFKHTTPGMSKSSHNVQGSTNHHLSQLMNTGNTAPTTTTTTTTTTTSTVNMNPFSGSLNSPNRRSGNNFQSQTSGVYGLNRHKNHQEGQTAGFKRVGMSNLKISQKEVENYMTELERLKGDDKREQLCRAMADQKFVKILKYQCVSRSNSLVEKIIHLLCCDEFLSSLAERERNTCLSYFMNNPIFHKECLRFLNLKNDANLLKRFVDFVLQCLTICQIYAHNFKESQAELYAMLVVTLDSQESKKYIERITVLMNKGTELSEQMHNQNQDEQSISGIPVYPCAIDFVERTKELPKNLINQPFASTNQYIATNFKLLRENFIQPLRDGFKSFINSKKHKMRDLPFYKQAKFKDYHFNRGEFSVSLTFKCDIDLARLRLSRYLTGGSLLCLFPSNIDLENLSQYHDGNINREDNNNIFVDPIICIVCSNERINQSILDVSFYSIKDLNRFDREKEYVMFESPVYFKSIGPVLEGLKSIYDGTIPFSETLTTQNTETNIPEYINAAPHVDISSVMRNCRNGIINVKENWISIHDTILDESQSNALRHILTNDISIIQGPPGTGKTFLGAHSVKIINKHLSQNGGGIILCVCYTNHALDQFLEMLIDDIPQLIRLGSRSRSENESLQNRNLHNLKTFGNRSIAVIDAKLHDLRGKLSNLQKYINMEPFDLLAKKWQKIYQKFQYIEIGEYKYEEDVRKVFDVWLNNTEAQYHKMKLKEEKRKMKKTMIENRKSGNTFGILSNDQIQHSSDGNVNNQQTPLIETPSSDLSQEEINEFQKVETKQKRQSENLLQESPLCQSDGIGEEEEEEYILRIALEDIQKNERLLQELEAEGTDFSLEHEDKSDKVFNLLDYNISMIDSIQNIWQIPAKRRKDIIKIIVDNIKMQISNLFKEIEQRVRELTTERSQKVDEERYTTLSKAPLIGMTSTAAALNRHILQRLEPKVIVIEEAAELLECQVLSFLTKKVEHLILIGDHMQLRPKVDVYELEKKYNFHISMMERLVKRGIDMKSLERQSRMRPEISKYIKPFYSCCGIHIEDSNIAKDQPTISGICTNVLFFSHSEQEEVSQQMNSKRNKYEARFVVALAKYLQHQRDYSMKDITILTPYLGQRHTIMSNLRKNNLHEIKTYTVDDFQGEENKIIIISLVRSNPEKNIGFVGNQNRIIVTLSRAKQALFIFGNEEILYDKSDDWCNVLNQMKKDGKIMKEIPVGCINHPLETKIVKMPEDFDSISHGGCSKTCKYYFPCGHQCGRLCHPKDQEHIKEYKQCIKICNMQYEKCKHFCQGLCHHGSKCKPCTQKIAYTFPACQHQTTIECCTDTSKLRCEKKCGMELPCGHRCNKICQNCQVSGHGLCMLNVETKCQHCNRAIKHKCHEKDFICSNPCTETLPCGHQCSGTCEGCRKDGKHQQCKYPCKRQFVCSHSCEGNHSCSEKKCAPCEGKCPKECPHGKCMNLCKDECVKCREPCVFQCDCPNSRCTNFCEDPCSRDPCNKRCKKILNCNHQCRGLCGEPCPPCLECELLANDWSCALSLQSNEFLESDELLYMLPCKHVFSVDLLDMHMDNDSNAIAYKKCPLCKKLVFVSGAPRYEKQIRKAISIIEALKREQNKKLQKETLIENIRAISEGAWHMCPNGHFYVIGECTQAMETSVCPDCGATIGGGSHTLHSTNSRIGNRDDTLNMLNSSN